MLQFLPVRNTAYISLLNLLTGYVGVCLANCYNQKRFLEMLCLVTLHGHFHTNLLMTDESASERT